MLLFTGVPYVGKELMPEVVCGYVYGFNEVIDNGFLKKVEMPWHSLHGLLVDNTVAAALGLTLVPNALRIREAR